MIPVLDVFCYVMDLCSKGRMIRSRVHKGLRHRNDSTVPGYMETPTKAKGLGIAKALYLRVSPQTRAAELFTHDL